MLAETRRRLLARSDRPPGVRHPGRARQGARRSPRARSAATWRRSTWPARSSGRTAGRSTSGEVRAMPALEDRAATATAEKQAIGRATAALDRRRRHGPARRRHDDAEVARALLGRPVQVVTNSLPIAQLLAVEQADRPDPDRRLRLPQDRRGAGPAGDRDDAGHPGPQGDPGGGRDRGRGDLQLEPAPGRDRAADDGVRAGSDDRRRPHQVRPALAGAALRARARSTRSSSTPACPTTYRALLEAAGRARSTWRRAPTTERSRPTASPSTEQLEERSMSTRHPADRATRSSDWSARSCGSSSAPNGRDGRPTALPAEPRRQHLGAALST